jgi:hypothetical protein
MRRNYLKSVSGDEVKTIMAAAAYNMMKWMRLKQQEIFDAIFGGFTRLFFGSVKDPIQEIMKKSGLIRINLIIEL